jgi:hypothetical protein
MIKEKAELFIRGTLGCQCPEKLFEELGEEVELSNGPLFSALSRVDEELPSLTDRIFSVGGRLLVIVIRSSSKEIIQRFLDAGREVRDSLGFNRFRLAVFVAGPVEEKMTIVPDHPDERIHLHLLW